MGDGEGGSMEMKRYTGKRERGDGRVQCSSLNHQGKGTVIYVNGSCK